MPFQDIDETALVDIHRPPSVAERWLRKIFVEDWSLKLLALMITLFLWVAVTDDNKPKTIRTTVQLNFVRPDNLIISNDPPKSVDVLLTGSRSNLDNVKLPDLVASVDVSDNRPGDRVIRLSPDRIHMELPDGVKIDSFQPSTIPVRLEPRVHKQVPVEVKLEGKPADGYEVLGTKAQPDMVTVRGPASRVDGLQKVPTETISVEGKKDSFTLQQVAVDIPDQKIDVMEALIDIAVDIAEKGTERSFTEVSTHSPNGIGVRPKMATITLSGPTSVIEQLRPGDVKVVVDLTNTGAGIPRLELPSSIKDRIKLVSIKPSKFMVSR
jgi:YbbR domain-containing protein